MLKKVKMFSSLLLIGACRFIKPVMPEIEKHFQRFNLSKSTVISLLTWLPVEYFGIPSFVVIENGQELGRLVNKDRKKKKKSVHFN